jgi:1,2-diacylglycerol 3-alpha-glucosyltransferase
MDSMIAILCFLETYVFDSFLLYDSTMNIGVFSYYYLPVVNGVTLTIADWKKWAKQDHVYCTVCIPKLHDTSHPDPDVFEYQAIPLWRRFGITVPLFPENAIMKSLTDKRVHILHVHHPFYIGNVALTIKRLLHIPLIFTYHSRYSDYVTSYFPLMSKKFARSMVNTILVRFMNCCDAVTVANTSLKYELLNMGVRVPIFEVPPGIDTDIYGHGDREKTRKRLGFSKNDTVLLYVGRLAREKNIYFLLRTFIKIHRSNTSVKLLLAGNGLESRQLHNLVHRKHMSDSVVFAEGESPDSIADIYAAADVFIYASQTETFGRVIGEAMSARLPVVALGGPSVNDIITNGVNGVVVFKKSTHIFARTVIELLRNKPQLTALGAAAELFAKKEYDSRVSWQKLYAVYQTVLAHSSK